MEPKDVSDELWREYDFDRAAGPYRIEYPVKIWIGETTHRVQDLEGVVHCVPAPGRFGCVLRWGPRDTSNPVAF